MAEHLFYWWQVSFLHCWAKNLERFDPSFSLSLTSSGFRLPNNCVLSVAGGISSNNDAEWVSSGKPYDLC